MDFVAVVDQAIALLRQRGRLTYRTLQLQFQLDAEHLDALKDELIEGQRLAADEAGRILIWTGGTVAQALQAERGLSLQMRIGLHTGLVVVGKIGDDLRMDYTAVGDTTNLAARLQQMAPAGERGDQRGDAAARRRLLRDA